MSCTDTITKPLIFNLEEALLYIEAAYIKINNALEGSFEISFTSEEHIKLYSSVYNLCCQSTDIQEALYNKYQYLLKDYNMLLLSLKDKHDEYLLREFVQGWSNNQVMVKWLRRMFGYLDRYYVARNNLPKLNDVGITTFRDMTYHERQSKVKDVVLALIHKEREGGQIDRALVKNGLDIYCGIGMEKYEEDFESFFLEDTESYYSRKASIWIQEDSCPQYMIKAEECLKLEKERATHYLHEITKPKLVEIVQKELLIVVAKQLIENEDSGFNALLSNDKRDDMSRMFRLYVPIPQELEPMADLFRQYVIAEGNELIQQACDSATNGVQDQVIIRNLIELHDKYKAYVVECFQNHNLFYKALQDAFIVFCNKKVAGVSSAEILSTYCDNILKKGGGQEKLSDEAVEDTLEKVVILLSHIDDKDIFAEFYRKKLARRLLFDRSGDDSHERSLLTKLKQEFGGQYTSKMEGMVTDMTLSKENQKHFEDYVNTKMTTKLGIDFSVTVFTSGFWPKYKSSDLNLPTEMINCLEAFKTFYATKTSQRKLSWIYSMGNCHIVGKFDQKPIELIVSTFQAAVLLLFNNTERLSYTEIMEQLNLNHEDLVRLLHSLSCDKYKILNKEPMSKSISITDTFEFNSKFTDKMRRIKVPLRVVDERKKVVEDVEKDRRFAIDAAVVRIMKSRKVLGNQELMSECIEYLSKMFKPDIKMIKKRIEDLITRDYLERDDENPNTFKYVA